MLNLNLWKETNMNCVHWRILSAMLLVVVSSLQAAIKSNSYHQGASAVKSMPREDGRFWCEECAKSFVRREGLETHILRHRNIRNFSCEQCSANFVTKGALTRHEKTHLSPQQRREVGMSICKICSHACDDSGKLRRHMKVHTPLYQGRCKRIKCPICETYFAQTNRLAAHVAAHKKDEELAEQVHIGAERALLQGVELEEFTPLKVPKHCTASGNIDYFGDE